jgi:hypothetical protein
MDVSSDHAAPFQVTNAGGKSLGSLYRLYSATAAQKVLLTHDIADMIASG